MHQNCGDFLFARVCDHPRNPSAGHWRPLGAGERCTGLPWFWSDQYEILLQIAGHPELGACTIERAVGDDGLLLFHLADGGQVVGVSGVGPTSFLKEFKVARVIAEHGLTLDPTALGDPATRLKTLLR